MNPPPTIGRTVHFVLHEGPNVGQIRPAIITRVWRVEGDTTPTRDNECVQLTVFPDAANDGLGSALGVSSSPHNPDRATPRTWSWPAR